MSHHLVESRALSFAYPDGTRALDGVSFRISHGEAVALVGANGAGKSTLLLHLAGCLAPTSGEVRVGDLPLNEKTLPAVRRAVGLVFQDPDDQLFMPTAFEDVAFGPANLGLPRDEVAARASEALAAVGASHLGDRPPHRLSIGEKRRVAIASVLSMAPDILVLDEPTASLDPRGRRRLIELLRAFSHTKIVATHDLDFAVELCGRTILLRDGRVAADGPTSEILGDLALLENNGLEPPLALNGCPRCGVPPFMNPAGKDR